MVADPAEQLLARTWRPALSVTGVDGIPPVESAGNVLRPHTSLQLSVRLPPTCDHEAALDGDRRGAHRRPAVRRPRHLRRRPLRAGLERAGVRAVAAGRARRGVGRRPSATPTRAFGEGGSIPFMGMLGEMFPDAQFVITGVLGPGANAHGPNEYLHVPTARRVTRCLATVLNAPRHALSGPRPLDAERVATVPARRSGTPMTVTTNLPQDDQATALVVERVFFELRKVIVGQSRLIERMLVGLLSQGHCLLESVPGLAKTLAAETLSKVVGGTFGRVQFTPDLLPSDIVGTRIFRSSSEKFDVELGPVFVNFLLADEINRAPAKVQSALLEVMAEQHVTIGGNTYDVPVAVLRDRHAEPDRVGGRVPAARGAARPVHDEDHHDASLGRRGDGDRRPNERLAACPRAGHRSRTDWPTCSSERRGCSSIAACSSTPSTSCRRRARPRRPAWPTSPR